MSLSHPTSFTVCAADASTDAEWDDFVARHPYRALPHLRAARSLQTGWRADEDKSFLIKDSLGHVVAVCPLFLLDQPVLRWFRDRRLASSTISGNGPLIDLDLPRRLQADVLAFIEREMRRIARDIDASVVSVVLPVFAGERSVLSRYRHHPLLPFGYAEELLPMIVLDLDRPEAEIFAGFRKSSRPLIRQAERNGVNARPVATREEWLGFDEANQWTQADAALPRSAMERAWDELIAPGHAIALAVEHDGKPVSVIVVTIVNRVAHYLLSFNSPRAYELAANHVAVWEGIREARRRGARWFELGPLDYGVQKDAQIAHFKMGFGGIVWYQSRASLQLNPFRSATRELAVQSYRALKQRWRGAETAGRS